jgi:hypothetical protein
MLLGAMSAHSADPRIVDAAKKEGRLVAYVSMLTEKRHRPARRVQEKVSVHRHLALPRQYPEVAA